ncbi:MAG: DNA-processing protein DprA [Proteobacteria bacterium]|nr:DNA-processing protein DprA [Pseudomonadota bacterium]
MMIPLRIGQADDKYPQTLNRFLENRAPKYIFALGNLDLLRQETIALFCSVKCPGNLILKTYDLARQLRDAGTAVISGFHSPMEKECLSLLLRGEQPIIWCLAKRLTPTRIPKEYADALSKDRLLMLSPFGERTKRADEQTARIRNEFVAALADRVFVAHAASGGKTEKFCRKVIGWGKPLLTFKDLSNIALLNLGALPFSSLEGIGSEGA